MVQRRRIARWSEADRILTIGGQNGRIEGLSAGCGEALAGACARGVKNPIPFLRRIAIIEAISFLILLFVAMPLKYFKGMPLAVRIVGLIHGMLFLVFCFALYRVMTRAKWPISRGALIFAAALLPFGPFVVDRRMREYEHHFDAAHAR